jgi:hypothetical protein
MTTRARLVGWIACTALLGVSAVAGAQPAPDAWKITVAPYMMAAGMNGTTGIGSLESDVNLSASDIFKNLQFGFMGYVEVMKGKWGAATDIIWMALGSSIDAPLPVKVDVNQGGFTFVAIRQLSSAVDFRAGAVVNTVQPKITFQAPINRELSRTETWVDPMVGVKVHTPDSGGRWAFVLMADVGGFGVGSDIMVNIQPTAVVRFTQAVGLAFGYRWIYLKYENAGNDAQRRFLYDMTSSGPFVGFLFRF